ncbi:AP2 domain-containing protein [Bacillus paralicheniformis]|uniref:AP2 domain-containing protein n=1 Tax=Bacillus subtilis TaxID=1423 RepID=UPI002149CDBB|nr:AP2 domain-containing protein [Bacillus subtilis]MCR1994507.1 AP2 domain-containing protein [Bacillus subtilis]UAL15319.1 HNH endonuclease [Bacillus paralicheniformis]UAL27890.1 AP2 domain-containing protein [Bacillus paralicheniformis]
MAKIPLHGKRGSGKFAIVDDEDFDYLSKYKWRLSTCGYAVRTGDSGAVVRMHREVMDTPEGLVTDHINQNKLDNRKENLRVCTVAQNNMNSKKPIRNGYRFKGVSRLKHSGDWSATISINGRAVYIGRFNTEEEAAKAYDFYAKEHYGEYASLNFPNETPSKQKRKIPHKDTFSGYRGVYWADQSRKWFVKVVRGGKSYYLGLFSDKHDAARMYNFWAIDLLGEKSILNHIEEEIS